MESIFTKNKDADLEILSKLDDNNLLSVCQAYKYNKYGNKLCKEENFWRNRIIEYFLR